MALSHKARGPAEAGSSQRVSRAVSEPASWRVSSFPRRTRRAENRQRTDRRRAGGGAESGGDADRRRLPRADEQAARVASRRPAPARSALSHRQEHAHAARGGRSGSGLAPRDARRPDRDRIHRVGRRSRRGRKSARGEGQGDQRARDARRDPRGADPLWRGGRQARDAARRWTCSAVSSSARSSPR